jgi:hypothetical protein
VQFSTPGVEQAMRADLAKHTAAHDIPAPVLSMIPTTRVGRPDTAAIRLGIFAQLKQIALQAYDRIVGLLLTDIAVDGAITKAPGGGKVAGPSPVDRRKQGMKRSVLVEGYARRSPKKPPPGAARQGLGEGVLEGEWIDEKNMGELGGFSLHGTAGLLAAGATTQIG